MSEHYSDKELLDLISDSERSNYGFNLLVKKYQEQIYRQVRRIILDHDNTNDVTQQVFIKVWQNISRFENKSSLETWIYRIAYNESISFIRKEKRRSFFSFDSYLDKYESTLTETNGFSGDEIQKKLHLAIASLPPKQQAVFNLKYFEEMKYEKMSVILDTSVGALKASYHIAVKKIEQNLNKN